jgi:hypothetical protein
MDDELSGIEARLRVLETLVAFQFAAQHMQTSDPAAAVRRLRELLVDNAREGSEADPELAPRVRAELQAALDRIQSLQEQLPRRLVD